MFRLIAAAVLMLGLGACALKPRGAVAPTGAGPQGAVELGDYEKEPEAKVLAAFQKEIAGRYAAGAAIAAALKDLQANKFACAASGQKGGDPPDQICRRTLKAGECTYTWQAHLFDDDGGKLNIARVRGLYDRTCGKEDLLGG